MKISLDTERAMLLSVVLPTLQKLRELIKQGEEAQTKELAAKDVLGLLIPYRESEEEKYQNAPQI